MSGYKATVVPESLSLGYDGPQSFPTAEQAWAYLLRVRQRDEGPDDSDPYVISATEAVLEALSQGHAVFLRHTHHNPTQAALIWSDGTGSVSGPSPGYEGHHDDVRMTYTVSIEPS